jgi:hypothetical protein
VKITDAGSDNWEYLATLPPGPEILDFFHATEHLASALAAIHGDGTLLTFQSKNRSGGSTRRSSHDLIPECDPLEPRPSSSSGVGSPLPSTTLG